jgi:hypothetical protein
MVKKNRLGSRTNFPAYAKIEHNCNFGKFQLRKYFQTQHCGDNSESYRFELNPGIYITPSFFDDLKVKDIRKGVLSSFFSGIKDGDRLAYSKREKKPPKYYTYKCILAENKFTFPTEITQSWQHYEIGINYQPNKPGRKQENYSPLVNFVFKFKFGADVSTFREHKAKQHARNQLDINVHLNIYYGKNPAIQPVTTLEELRQLLQVRLDSSPQSLPPTHTKIPVAETTFKTVVKAVAHMTLKPENSWTVYELANIFESYYYPY